MMRALVIEKTFGGYRVRSDPPHRAWRVPFRFARDNRAFSEAVGYASHWAAELGLAMVDGTGRLSATECAGLVEGQRRQMDGLPDR